MEALKLNVRKNRSKDDNTLILISVMGYVYDLKGIQVILHESTKHKGRFLCSEYYTGRSLCASQDTMQKALDATFERIGNVGLEKTLNTIKIKVIKEGYANEPDHCLWCNTPKCNWCAEHHYGGPENCKGVRDE